VVDTSGNSSSTSDPNAQARFVIDTAGPRVISTSPVSNTVPPVVNGQISVGLVINETTASTSVNATSIRAVRAGADGKLGTADDVALAISGLTISGSGSASIQEFVNFVIQGATASDLYRVIVSGATPGGVTDVAGNVLDGDANGTSGGDYNLDFVVYNPTSTRFLFVDDNATGAAPTGFRNDPFPTITQALAAASIGDVVAVLPGTYAGRPTWRAATRA
jgi:hypothetical protein